MNAYERMCRALEIFNGYEHERGIAADVGELFAGPHPDRVSQEHLDELKALGWHPDGDDCFQHYL